jgi:2-haloacid dehalogenase
MDEIKAILFDVFGTVVDWRGSLIADLSAWGTQNALNADWPGLVDAWRGAYIPSMQLVRAGERPWANLDELQSESLRALGPRFGLPDLTPQQHHYILQGWHRLHPWPDSVAGLTRLKQRFTIAPLSNGNLALLVNMAKHAALPWDTVFATELFRHYKPDPETYLGATSLLGLQPHQVMMAAAHNADLAAARALGLRTAFISRPTEYGPAQTTDKEATSDWDIITSDIEHLADQLTAKEDVLF